MSIYHLEYIGQSQSETRRTFFLEGALGCRRTLILIENHLLVSLTDSDTIIPYSDGYALIYLICRNTNRDIPIRILDRVVYQVIEYFGSGAEVRG